MRPRPHSASPCPLLAPAYATGLHRLDNSELSARPYSLAIERLANPGARPGHTEGVR
jgi:hypothetical protein